VTNRPNARLVYSTDTGQACPRCARPVRECACHASAASDQPVPARLGATLRLEKSGRGGKVVTVIDGLPRNDTFLKQLCSDLKRACGTGGAIKDGTIELQGDLRARVREFLVRKKFAVKG
jgi:translation initiation factor 1